MLLLKICKISGGTGITPFLQLLQSLAREPSHPTERFTLLHSSPTVKQLPPPEIWQPIGVLNADPKQKWFSCKLFVDSIENENDGRVVSSKPLVVRRIGALDIQEAISKSIPKNELSSHYDSPKTLILICGPDRYLSCVEKCLISQLILA